MLTCYDYATAAIMAQSDIDALLVGDSLGMVFQGNLNTLSVTIEDMIYHTKAVRKGHPQGFIVTDMPFLSYHISIEETVKQGGRIIKESAASALKLEGGAEILPHIRALINAKIPVMGHLGLTPQSVNVFGGFKVQGKNKEQAEKLIQDAFAIQNAGAFALVLECVPEKLSTLITSLLDIAVIGIGCGAGTDGQVLVINDALGFTAGKQPKFSKKYAHLNEEIQQAIARLNRSCCRENSADRACVFD